MINKTQNTEDRTMMNIRTLNDAELNLVSGGVRQRDPSEATSDNTTAQYDPSDDNDKS